METRKFKTPAEYAMAARDALTRGDADEAQAIYAGAQDFIRKPFDPALLVRRVERMIRLRGDRPRHVDLKTALGLDGTRNAPPMALARRVL